MKQQYAEILFYLMGTRASPTSERFNFLSFVENYQKACDKMNGLDEIEKYLENHRDLKIFFFETSNNGSNYIEHLEAYGHESEIQDILQSYTLEYTLSGITVSLSNIQNIKFKALTRDERDALDMVDNFERNKLMDTLGDGTKVKVSKI